MCHAERDVESMSGGAHAPKIAGSGAGLFRMFFSLFFSPPLFWMQNKRLNSEGRRVCLNPTGGGGQGKTSTAGTRTYSKTQKGVLSSILGAGEVEQWGY